MRCDAAPPAISCSIPGETRSTRRSRARAAAEVSGVLRHDSARASTSPATPSSLRRSAGLATTTRGCTRPTLPGRSTRAATLELGKRALRWGKGYAWSPVAFLERPKDPTDPELAREGFVMATGAWVRSFDGAAADLVAERRAGAHDVGPQQRLRRRRAHVNPAVKLYGLVSTRTSTWSGRRAAAAARASASISRATSAATWKCTANGRASADAPRALLTPATRWRCRRAASTARCSACAT